MAYSFRQQLAAAAAGGFATAFFGFSLRHLRLVCRWHESGPLPAALGDPGPRIVVVWHQDVFLLFQYLAIRTHLERRIPKTMLASRSFDGEVTEHVVRPWGFRCVRGSRDKPGGYAALRALRRDLEAGRLVVLVGDGPGPPPFVLQPGAVYLARETGAPLYAARAWARPQIILPGAWIRMAVPLPGAHCAFFSAGPLDVSGEEEAARERVEGVLRDLCRRADAFLYLGAGAAAAPDV